jgi:diguanylate cyclase (GGDEF)-like protein
MQGIYNAWLVALSIAVAVLVSYTALKLAARVALADRSVSSLWLFGGATAMGIGIWSMHFIGMLAFSLPIPLRYDIATTLGSLAVAIVTSGVAIKISSGPNLSFTRLGVGSLVMGGGICAMHYSGMAAIQIVPMIRYEPRLVAASIAIAVSASFVALWLAFRLRHGQSRVILLARLAAAVVMGLAISGMHYTAMAASAFGPNSYCRGGAALNNDWLALTIGVISVGLLVVALIVDIYDTHLTSRRRLQARLEQANITLHHQATHDALTGLANRREFEQQLLLAIEDQKRTATDYALLYLDLDQLKVVNDTCGHGAGDELIRQVSWAVRKLLRDGDVLARLGGDEFGALLARCPQEMALKLAESIRSEISEQRFIWEGKLFVVAASIGVLELAECLPTVSAVMSAADQACYLAKDNGRNRVQYYRPDDQEVRTRHGEMQWVERINAALELDRFALFAQEIRPVAGGRASRGEAEPSLYEILLRLVDTDGDLIAPMAFIPAAERYGLMPRIDRWVIAHATKAIAEMRSSYAQSPVCMINLSGASVSDPGLAEFVGALLAQYGLPWSSIGFELTETAAITNLTSASLLMNQFKKLGCPIALDDFGSGMSSFSYLRRLPVDLLKIDGTFVTNMATDPIDYAVVESIQNIARVMGIRTVAESVEDQAALSALTQVGVDFAQGFYLGRPVPLHAVTLAGPAAGDDMQWIFSRKQRRATR